MQPLTHLLLKIRWALEVGYRSDRSLFCSARHGIKLNFNLSWTYPKVFNVTLLLGKPLHNLALFLLFTTNPLKDQESLTFNQAPTTLVPRRTSTMVSQQLKYFPTLYSLFASNRSNTTPSSTFTKSQVRRMWTLTTLAGVVLQILTQSQEPKLIWFNFSTQLRFRGTLTLRSNGALIFTPMLKKGFFLPVIGRCWVNGNAFIQFFFLICSHVSHAAIFLSINQGTHVPCDHC